MAKTPTNLKSMVPKKYHKFLNAFLKKAVNTFSPHSKYDHQILLLERCRDHSYHLFSKMSESKFQFIKKFLK